MQYCDKCNVHVTGSRKHCPLCQGSLTGSEEPEKEVFPVLPQWYSRSGLLLRALVFLSVTAAVVCFTVNALLPVGRIWSLFVAAGIAFMWIGIATALRKRHNIPKTILWEVVLLSLFSVFWDLLAGKNWSGWSVDYVIPSLCVFALLSMMVIAKILRIQVRDYLIYLMIGTLFGILPIIFLLTGIVRVRYPSILCVAASAVFLTALLSFQGRNMRAELKKKLHL